MKYRKLGDSNLKISTLSFGCMSLGTNFSENKSIIHEAIDLGINFFDTADLYQHGLNEKHLGQSLKGKRSSVYIASKVGNQWKPDGKSWEWNPRKKYILEAIDKSLKRLETDYIDLYQLHGGTLDDPIDETIEAFEQLIHQGKIRYYGISSIRPNVIKEYIDRSNIVSVMMQYSLLDRRPEETCLDLIHGAGKGVLVRGSLAKGLLINKKPKEYLSHPADYIRNVQAALENLPSPVSNLQASLQYPLSHKAVSSVVCGIRNGKQLKETVHFSQVEPILNSENIDTLQTVTRANIYQQHRL
jgi:aryl-alcohol dehydrogenase-like predicted oxidoreductase